MHTRERVRRNACVARQEEVLEQDPIGHTNHTLLGLKYFGNIDSSQRSQLVDSGRCKAD